MKKLLVILFFGIFINPTYSQLNKESWISISSGFLLSETGLRSYPRSQTAEINYHYRLIISENIYFSFSPGINLIRDFNLDIANNYSNTKIHSFFLHSPILINFRLNKLRLYKASLNLGCDISYPFLYQTQKDAYVNYINKYSYFDITQFQIGFEFGTNISINQNNELGIKLAIRTNRYRNYSNNWYMASLYIQNGLALYPQLKYNHRFKKNNSN